MLQEEKILLLDRTKYAGRGQAVTKRMQQIRQVIRDRGGDGDHATLWMAHETDVPTWDAFPS